MIKRIIPLLAVVAIVAAGFLLTQRQEVPQHTFKLLSGESKSLAELRGQVLLVNFWATSCVTCVKEMPELAALEKTYADRGYRTLAVAMQYDPPAFVATFVKQRQLPFLVAHDGDGSAARAFGDVRLTPTSFLIDRQGRIVQHWLGAPDWNQLKTTIEGLLAS